MWIDAFGSNMTSQEVCEFLSRCVGAFYTVDLLESTYSRGEEYQNGGVWLQRIQ